MSEIAPNLRPALTRREFIKELTRVTIMIGVPIGLVDLYSDLHHDHQRSEQAKKVAQERLLAQDSQITAEFNNGLSDGWFVAQVFPGAAVIPPSVNLYKTAELKQESLLAWPSTQTQSHLLVQRPFMVKATAELNQDQELKWVGSEVMAFWLPDSNNLVFCNVQDYPSQIVLGSQLYGQVPTKQVNEGDQIQLEPAQIYNGLTWRYIRETEINYYAIDGLSESAEVVDKVCGRSKWGTPSETATAYFDFTSGESPDIIQLPLGLAHE